MGAAVVALVVLVLTLRAQILLPDPKYAIDGVLLYGLAVAGFLWAFHHESIENATAVMPRSDAISSLRWPWISAGGVMSLAAVLFFGGNRFRAPGALLWLGGLFCFVIALSDEHGLSDLLHRLGEWLATSLGEVIRLNGVRCSWPIVALGVTMLVGAFLRLYRLDELPSDMTADIGHLWVDTESILRGDHLIYSTIHPGREIMMFYLTAGYVRLFGHGHYAYKMVAALVGVATIPIVYLLGKECFDQQVGLLGAFFLAVSRWHITISRIGWRLVLLPPFVALIVVFLVRALRTGHRRDWLLGGLCLGLGLYTYNASRALVLAVVLVFVVEWLRGRGYPRRRLLRDMAFSLGVSLWAFLPMGRFAVENPERFWFRILTRISSVEAPLPKDPLGVLLGNGLRTALMFNVRGDGSFAANIPTAPQLDTVMASLFALGSAYCLWRWRRSMNLLFLVFAGAMLFTGALSLAFPHEVPSAVRSSGVLPFACLLSGLALTLLARAWQGVMPTARGRLVVGSGVVALILACAYLNYTAYFVTYPGWLPHRNYPLHRELSRTIDQLSRDREVYLKYLPYWIDGDVIRLQLRNTPPEWDNIQPDLDLLVLERQSGTGFAVILHPQDEETLEGLTSHFLHATWFSVRMPSGEVAFRVFLAGPDDPEIGGINHTKKGDYPQIMSA